MKKYLIFLSGFLFIFARPVYCIDSTEVPLFGSQTRPKVFKSYVNVNDCVSATSPVWKVYLGVHTVNPQQVCPKHHPIMYAYKEDAKYVATPAVVGAWGTTTSVCCALAYRWE